MVSEQFKRRLNRLGFEARRLYSTFLATDFKPLRILTYRWHVPHQYELYRTGHKFTLISDGGTAFCDGWEYGKRPLPANAGFIPLNQIDFNDYDLAILHFDENIITPQLGRGIIPSDWGNIFKTLLKDLTIPKVAICHGTPAFKGQFTNAPCKESRLHVLDEEVKKIVSLLGDTHVICNSNQAQIEWGFKNSQTIWHGFRPREFVKGSNEPTVFAMGDGPLNVRPYYNGAHIFREMKDILKDSVKIEDLEVAPPITLRLKDQQWWAIQKFKNYIESLGRHSIYVNPTLRSPMPRTRGEAMMTGAVTISMKNHDVDMFIENGKNGFYCESGPEMAEKIQWLLNNKKSLEKMTFESRKTAVKEFSSERFIQEWNKLLISLL